MGPKICFSKEIRPIKDIFKRYMDYGLLKLQPHLNSGSFDNFLEGLKNKVTMTNIRSKIGRSPSEYLKCFHGQCNISVICLCAETTQVPFPFISPTSDFLNAKLIHPLIEKSTE